ncbi:leucine rich repeat-containing protein [Besnoitia besnoiti]|uniref:Leucine rich repeat-containing protein n=1 Tax=Besnoitia besnoiti TaxID=94643 RepID=A0A2A9MF56_BESBE|nr:leucine rich repeat-containing protein [Besnoitia besnoiti]PFH34267.1 leucine rich repeat-containing protein [Besnoitia besnoiti]
MESRTPAYGGSQKGSEGTRDVLRKTENSALRKLDKKQTTITSFFLRRTAPTPSESKLSGRSEIAPLPPPSSAGSSTSPPRSASSISPSSSPSPFSSPSPSSLQASSLPSGRSAQAPPASPRRRVCPPISSRRAVSPFPSSASSASSAPSSLPASSSRVPTSSARLSPVPSSASPVPSAPTEAPAPAARGRGDAECMAAAALCMGRKRCLRPEEDEESHSVKRRTHTPVGARGVDGKPRHPDGELKVDSIRQADVPAPATARDSETRTMRFETRGALARSKTSSASRACLSAAASSAAASTSSGPSSSSSTARPAPDTPSLSPVSLPSHFGLADFPEEILQQILDCCPSECLLVSHDLAAAVRRRRRLLRLTHMNAAEVQPQHLLAAVRGYPQLRLLEVVGVPSLSARFFESFANSRSACFPQRLQVLVLQKCPKLTSRLFRALTTRLHRLRAVDLQDNCSLNYSAVAHLRLLPKLERVALGVSSSNPRGTSSHCNMTLRALLGPPSASPAAAAPAASGPARGEAEDAQTASRKAGPAAERGEAPKGDSLQHPEAASSDLQLTQHGGNASESQGAQPAPPLKLLSLSRCTALSSLDPLINVASTLEFLDLRGCTALTDTSAAVLGSLVNLQILVLSDTGITSTTVALIAENCRKLEMLDLSRIAKLTKAAALLVPLHLLRLTRLKLSKNSAIDEECLRDCLVRLKALTLLDVSHCWRVSSGFCVSPPLPQVPEGMALRRLGLFGCNVERQRVEDALRDAGASRAQLCLHHELPMFDLPCIYANMSDLDLRCRRFIED